MSFSTYFNRNQGQKHHYQSLPVFTNKLLVTSSNTSFKDTNKAEHQIVDTISLLLRPYQVPQGKYLQARFRKFPNFLFL